METVDIVLASYNGESYIGEQIDSIIKNTYPHWRLFVCDDGSKDRTGEIVMDYETRYPEQIFWVPNVKNKGVIANFLDGAKNCSSDYVMFSDQDDYWLPNKIELTMETMKRTEQEFSKKIPIVVFTDATVVNQTLDVKKGSFHQIGHLDTTKLDLPHMLMENKIMGCTMMINKSTKEKLEKPSKETIKNIRMHDWWVALIAASFGKIVYVDKQTMLYRQHETNVVGSQKFSINMILGKLKGFREIRKVLKATCRQANEFYELFGDELDKKTNEVVKDFTRLYEVGWIRRRVILLKHGFFKSGIVRNIGLMLLG